MSAGIELTQTESSENPSLPNSRRVYIDGELPGVRVPFREISLSPSKNYDGTIEENAPVRVYDTSGRPLLLFDNEWSLRMAIEKAGDVKLYDVSP